MTALFIGSLFLAVAPAWAQRALPPETVRAVLAPQESGVETSVGVVQLPVGPLETETAGSEPQALAVEPAQPVNPEPAQPVNPEPAQSVNSEQAPLENAAPAPDHGSFVPGAADPLPAPAEGAAVQTPEGAVQGEQTQPATMTPSSGPAAAEDDAFNGFDEFETSAEKPKRSFDPLMGYNRVMYKVNDKLYFWLLKPVARTYGFIFPEFFRASISRGFSNLGFPLRFVNSLLQLRLKKAGTELGRFIFNSTVGIGGLFDPADRWLGWRASDEDFGQTLGRYGVGDGFPVVLPVLGQTNLRDGLGMIPNFLLSPLTYVTNFDVRLAVSAGEQFNYASLHIGEYESIKKDALDPYTFIRDAYKQNRDKRIEE